MSTQVTGAGALFSVDAAGNAMAQTGNTNKVKSDFSAFMNLNSFNRNASADVDSVSATCNKSDSTAGSAGTAAYDAYQYKESANVKVKENVTYSDEKAQDIQEKMGNFSEDVKSVLKENLSVTDDEIEAAMETLQLSYVDLLNPQNLTALVSELTGSDNPMELLMSEAFTNIFSDMEEITENLLQQLGMTKEELVSFCEQMTAQSGTTMTAQGVENQTISADEIQSAAEQTDTVGNENNSMTESSPATEQTDEVQSKATEQTDEVQSPATEQTDKAQNSQKDVGRQALAGESQNADKPIVTKEAVQESQPEETAEETSAVKETNAPAENTQEDMDENASGDETSSQKKNETPSDKTQTGNSGVIYDHASYQTIGSTDTFSASTQYTPQQITYAEVKSILEQISEFTKVTNLGDTTTMEMQLNPENLGKIYIHVSEKAGNITAQIAASNETVKEALQAQVVDLKESLNQQGIKVDAVEVTVASHEFEQNLEQNAREDQRSAEQSEEQKASGTRRNINLNDLENSFDDMSEEESLVAKMMQENGNQMDVTA